MKFDRRRENELVLDAVSLRRPLDGLAPIVESFVLVDSIVAELIADGTGPILRACIAVRGVIGCGNFLCHAERRRQGRRRFLCRAGRTGVIFDRCICGRHLQRGGLEQFGS